MSATSSVPVTARLAGALLLALLAAGGCTPTCEQVCRKTLACGLDSPRTSQDACVEDCDRQRTLYKDWWGDEQKVDAFAEHRQCLMQSTCDEIADGRCYDEELFLYGEP